MIPLLKGDQERGAGQRVSSSSLVAVVFLQIFVLITALQSNLEMVSHSFR